MKFPLNNPFQKQNKEEKKIEANQLAFKEEVWDQLEYLGRTLEIDLAFIQQAIDRKDKIAFAEPATDSRPGSYFMKELDYLAENGYKISDFKAEK